MICVLHFAFSTRQHSADMKCSHLFLVRPYDKVMQFQRRRCRRWCHYATCDVITMVTSSDHSPPQHSRCRNNGRSWLDVYVGRWWTASEIKPKY